MAETIKRTLINIQFDDGTEGVMNIRQGMSRKDVAEMLRYLADKVEKSDD